MGVSGPEFGAPGPGAGCASGLHPAPSGSSPHSSINRPPPPAHWAAQSCPLIPHPARARVITSSSIVGQLMKKSIPPLRSLVDLEDSEENTEISPGTRVGVRWWGGEQVAGGFEPGLQLCGATCATCGRPGAPTDPLQRGRGPGPGGCIISSILNNSCVLLNIIR